jgi:hypothetical protein
MFDNQTTGQGNAPAPGTDDIFSGLDQGSAPAPVQPQAPFSVEDSNLARQIAAEAGAGQETANKRLILVGSIVLGLLLLASGVWFALMNLKTKSAADTAANPAAAEIENTNINPTVPAAENPAAAQNATGTPAGIDPLALENNPNGVAGAASQEASLDAATTTASSSASGLPVEPAQPTTPAATAQNSDIPEAVKQAAMGKTDSDGDGLTDEEEKQLGTYPDRVDTDGDGLSDYEEVKTYLTNPKNPDTDGDTFKDGDEVKNGYNPKGTGKLTR